MTREVYSIKVEAGSKAALRRLVEDHKNAARRWRGERLAGRPSRAARLAVETELASLVVAGRVLPDLSAAVDWGLRLVLANRGLDRAFSPAPQALAGRPLGVGERVGGAETLAVRLARPFTPAGGVSLPLGEQVARAAHAASVEPSARLEAWEARFATNGQVPTARDRAERAALARRIVTTGDLVRAGLARVLASRPTPDLPQ